MQVLHQRIIQKLPNIKIWFMDGKNSESKLVSNHNIGYESNTIKYAYVGCKEFYQIGFIANTTGISLYILYTKDKTYLFKTYSEKLDKASVTGYCIKFKALKDINIYILEAAISYGVEMSQQE